MKQRLLLTSQGIGSEELKETFLSMIRQPSETSVMFVTTAAYGEEKNPTWLEVYRNQLRDCGISKIRDIDFKGSDRMLLAHELSDADVIFVNGGNTFYLLHYVKESGFDKTVLGLLKKGKVYVGISAGSYIACPTIEAAGWKSKDINKISQRDLTALNLVPFLISAHFNEGYRPVVEEEAVHTKYPIVALNDNQAILVEGNRYKIVGGGEVVSFNGFGENW